MGPSILLSFVLLVLINIITNTSATTKLPKFSALYVFGDSTVDTGNNDYTLTTFRSDHPPFGSSFPNKKPTGRFSNGRLVPDFLVSQLGIKELLPPFLDPSLSDEDIQTGVCFATAGSGFDDLTTDFSGVIPISKQPGMFKAYLARLKGIVVENEASKIVSDALFLLSAGSNDFFFNYYDIPTRRLEYNISGYQDFLLQRLQNIVKELYHLGGRKFAIASLPPIGCIPLQITGQFKNPRDRTCVDQQNSDSLDYNIKLEKLLPYLQASLPESKIVFADIYHPLMDMVKRPQLYGFTETLKGCCGTGFVEIGPLCNLWTPPCEDPSKFLFFDAVHPSEAAYRALSKFLIDRYIPQF